MVCEVDDFLQRFGGSRETHRSLSDRVKNLSDGMSHLSDYLGRMLECEKSVYICIIPTYELDYYLTLLLDFVFVVFYNLFLVVFDLSSIFLSVFMFTVYF